MKTRIVFTVFIALTIVLIYACSGTTEKDVAGTWKPADIKIDADTTIAGPEQIGAMERLEKSVYFVLNEDMSMQAFTSGLSINGTWSFNADSGYVYVRFEGNKAAEPSYLGSYRKGKLTKYHEGQGMKITTTYEKE